LFFTPYSSNYLGLKSRLRISGIYKGKIDKIYLFLVIYLLDKSINNKNITPTNKENFLKNQVDEQKKPLHGTGEI